MAECARENSSDPSRNEKGPRRDPTVQDGAIRLSAAQLGLLLEGLDWSRVRRKPVIAPLLLQARLAVLTSMLETQNSAVERLRLERDAFRAERDTANAEVEKLQLIIKQLMRSRYGARSEKLAPDQLQLALEEVAQSLGLASAINSLAGIIKIAASADGTSRAQSRL